MPPKKGKKKQIEDDWEAELGETIETPVAVEPSMVQDASLDDDEDGGGLMSQLGKSKKVFICDQSCSIH